MALPSFVRHLQVLEDASLVRSRKEGRVRTFWIVPDQMALAENWLARQHRLWERRLNQLDRFAATLEQKEDKNPGSHLNPGRPRSARSICVRAEFSAL